MTKVFDMEKEKAERFDRAKIEDLMLRSIWLESGVTSLRRDLFAQSEKIDRLFLEVETRLERIMNNLEKLMKDLGENQ